jgi:integrase
VALHAWLAHRRGARDRGGDAPGAAQNLFCAVSKGGTVTGTNLSDKAVARLVKPASGDAGLDADGFSGHSLRAGLASAAGDAGAGPPELMRQTRHKSTAVALGYLRPAELWTNNVSARIFAAAGVTQTD